MFWALKFDVWDKSGKPTKRITARDRKRKFRNCVFLLLGTGMLTGTFECVEGFICSFPELVGPVCRGRVAVRGGLEQCARATVRVESA